MDMDGNRVESKLNVCIYEMKGKCNFQELDIANTVTRAYMLGPMSQRTPPDNMNRFSTHKKNIEFSIE